MPRSVIEKAFEAQAPRRLRLAGAIALLIGLLAAIAAYSLAAESDRADAIGYRIVNGQIYAVSAAEEPRRTQELERIGGKGEVWIYHFDHWLGSLLHGKRLAGTLALASVAVALLCFHLASLMDGDAAEAATGPGPHHPDAPVARPTQARRCRGPRLRRKAHRGGSHCRLSG